MNKLKVGPLAVSRYHQISRFFPTEDTPNVPDHEFPNPGYLQLFEQVTSANTSEVSNFEYCDCDATQNKDNEPDLTSDDRSPTPHSEHSQDSS